MRLSTENRRQTLSAALCLIMPVIEAQRASILVPRDHRHINQMRTVLDVIGNARLGGR